MGWGEEWWCGVELKGLHLIGCDGGGTRDVGSWVVEDGIPPCDSLSNHHPLSLSLSRR